MKAVTLEKLVWILIYAGLVFGGFGLFLTGELPALGWTLSGLGIASIAGGAVLVAVRARMKGD
jgi:hypothetical protein